MLRRTSVIGLPNTVSRTRQRFRRKGGLYAEMWARQAEAMEDAAQAAEFVRELCEIESRSELDHDEEAAEIFHREIRGPFSKYLAARWIVS